MKRLPDNQIAFYQSPDGSVNIEVLYAEENIWLTQNKMAELFDTTPQNITQHLKNIYAESEVVQKATCKDFLQVQKEGEREVKRNTSFYSLEAIIAVGYRVNSERGTQFRQWATAILKNYIHKGYVLDSNRFKYGSRFSARYFDELYEEIKDIRSSERMLYQKITDIYATAIDYSPKAYESKQFFATVQNKLHFAITGKTAAEIIQTRVNSRKDMMGLTSWRRSPNGKIMPSDVVIAKNYLEKKELAELNRIVNMYLDYAAMQAARGRAMTMKDWVEKLNAFLKFSEHEILTNAGKISHEVAEELALKEYEKYRSIQDKNYVSDFDREVKKLLDSKKERFMEGYNPEVELAKGSTLTVASYDKTQKILVTAGKVTVGGKPGITEISGLATGKQDASIDGTINIWLSIFRYMRPDGTIDHVGGWNIPLTLKAKQTPIETAKAFAAYINAGTRPYKAKAEGNKAKATVTIVFVNK